jgi:catechol 2,3-dioxygenase
MVIPRVRRIAHIVLYVRDPESSAKWYCDVLGMRISARVPEGPYTGGVFLSFGEHDHDLAVFPGMAQAVGKEFEHIGLEVDCDGDLDQLRRLYGKMLQHKVRIHEVLDHGVSIGVYFFDPDGHQLEVFCQLIPHANGAAIAELGRNEGQANPIELEPLFD